MKIFFILLLRFIGIFSFLFCLFLLLDHFIRYGLILEEYSDELFYFEEFHEQSYVMMMMFHRHHLLMMVETRSNDFHVDIENVDEMIEHRTLNVQLNIFQ